MMGSRQKSLRVLCGVGLVAVILMAKWEISRSLRVEPVPVRAEEKDAMKMTPMAEIIRLAVVAPPKPRIVNAPSSPAPMKLVLVGTQAGRTPREGFAQIGLSKESAQTYQAGALLANGARLAEIHPKFVVLARDGSEERLNLESSLSAKIAVTGPISTINAANRPLAPEPVQSHEMLTDYIRPSPMYESGTLIGYQVYPGAKSMPFMQMGLRPGDVIVAINDLQLSDPESAIAELRELVNGATLSAVVKRQGEVERLQLDGGLLVRAQEALASTTNSATHPETGR
jgi:general secretion pathway protein C